MNDLLGGQVDIMCDQTTNTTGQIEAGKVKAYAVTTSKRLTTPALKNLPTLDEAGPEGLQRDIWHGALRAQGHAEGGRSTSSTRRCARRSRTRTSSSAKRRSAR